MSRKASLLAAIAIATAPLPALAAPVSCPDGKVCGEPPGAAAAAPGNQTEADDHSYLPPWMRPGAGAGRAKQAAEKAEGAKVSARVKRVRVDAGRGGYRRRQQAARARARAEMRPRVAESGSFHPFGEND